MPGRRSGLLPTALRRRAAGESGHTISEMLVVMAILGTVMAGLSGVFVSALRAEVDMNQRFQAQQEARLALGKLRRELHCSRQAFVAPGGDAATIVSAVAQNTAYCRAGTATWCAVPVSTGRFALYRKAGAACDAAGTKMADNLTSSAVFALADPVAFSRSRMRVDLTVDLDPRDAQRRYRLYDEITMRGSPRA